MRLAAFTASPRDSAFTASLTDSFPKLSFSLCTAKKGLHAAPAALNRTGRAAEANPRPGPAPDHTATDRRVQSGARPGQLHRREQEREREAENGGTLGSRAGCALVQIFDRRATRLHKGGVALQLCNAGTASKCTRDRRSPAHRPSLPPGHAAGRCAKSANVTADK